MPLCDYMFSSTKNNKQKNKQTKKDYEAVPKVRGKKTSQENFEGNCGHQGRERTENLWSCQETN